MKLVAQASKKRSLADFQTTVGKYSKELKGDKIVARHLDTLYQTMLEQNLCRIIEPYSRVQVIFWPLENLKYLELGFSFE